MKKKTLVDVAFELARKIEQEYNKLTIENKGFFNLYHDSMHIQKECAYQEVGSIDYHIKMKDNDEASQGIRRLQDTLKYCKAVIKLQEQTNKLPEAIFG